MTTEVVTLAGRYRLEQPIASGGMATVWRARDEVLDRPVAVKVLHAHLASDPELLARFRREALAAARLTHPHIVAIYDSGSETDSEGAERHFIVMEYCAGGSLADLLERTGALSPERVVAIALKVCDALGYAHGAGVIHRDVKPANVLLSEDGTLKVADFGIAKAAFAAGDITTTGSILGTVTYLAPEQLNGLEPDARSDVYSVGVMLYELLAGRPPFTGSGQLAVAMKIQRETPLPLRGVRVGVPRALDAAVLKALHKDPDQRYATVAELRAALTGPAAATAQTDVFEALGPSARPVPGETSDRAPERRPSTVLVVLAVALAVAVVITLPSMFGAVEDGPPTGPDDGRRGEPGGAPRALAVEAVSDFDPHGGDGEHPEDASLAVDGDPATSWTTENYSSTFDATGKPGVGLLFDLGDTRQVTRATVMSSTPGYVLELRAGDDVAADETGFDVVAQRSSAPARATLAFAEVAARYWLVWITALPGDGTGSASISEVRFHGP